MIKELLPGLRLMIALTILDGPAVSRSHDGNLRSAFPQAGEWQPGNRNGKVVGSRA